jgi:hypothetical protein
MLRALAALLVLAALAAPPGAAFAQSAGDDQYSDPFQGDDPAAEQPQPEAPAEQPATPPATVAEGGNGSVEAAQATGAPALPRTGLPLLAAALAGAALLGTGAVLRRRC